MTTLLEYAQQHFPEHEVECPDGAVPLNDITVVAHVVGRTRAASLVEGLRKALHAGIAREEPRIKTVIVEPTSPTMVNSGGEDPEGVVDLPVRRLAVGALIGGVILGSIVGVVGGLVASSLVAGVLVGLFGALLGAAAGAMWAGGGRYAGNRSWEQPHAPESAIVLVAATFDHEGDALEAAEVMATYVPNAVRIVAEDGAWRSPNI